MEMSPFLRPGEAEAALLSEFRQMAQEISVLSHRAGFRITPYRDFSLPSFRLLTPVRKQEALSTLRTLVSIYRSSLEKGFDLKDSSQMVWSAIGQFGLKPPSRLFDYLEEGDIIEIHSRSQQLFRSFEYFDYCSYSLEELVSTPWTMLYHRENDRESEMLTDINRALDSKEIIFPDTTEHVVEEIFAPFRLKMGYRLKLLSPLFTRNSSCVDHYLACVRAELKEPMPSGAEEEKLLTDHYRK